MGIDVKNFKVIKLWKYVAIAIFALFWFQVIAPEFEDRFSDHHNVMYSEVGINQIVPSFGEPLSEKFVINEVATNKIINQKGNILEIETRIVGKNILTDEIIFDLNKVYHIDKNTHMHVDESLGFSTFPENVEKKDYFMTLPEVIHSTTFIFIQEKIINGLETYQFNCSYTKNDISAAFPQFYPHNIVIDAQCTIFVEPITGNILNFEISWENYFVENGEKVQLAEIGSKKTTEYSTLILSEMTKKQLEYKNMIIFIPSGIFVLILIIFVSLDLFKKSKIELLHQTKLSEQLSEQIIRQENLKRAINESSDVAFTNTSGIITYANDEFCKTSKYSREELIGKNHRMLKSGNHSQEFYENMWHTITSGKVWHDIIQNKAKDGTLYWDDMFIVPFFDKNNEITEFISIRRNITERIKLHEEKIRNERMLTLGSFTSRLAHDLRNPLSIIQVSLENIKMSYGADENIQSHFDKINRSIYRITHQIDDVLNYVKGEPASMIMVRFSELLNEATDSLNIPDRIKLILPKTDIKFICDQKQFAIAINNLILNSIQAIPAEGIIEITIEENLSQVIIKVMDSGKGISKETLDKIFDPLYTTKLQGTGLGLISVKSIIELHGGLISVTSPPTIFTIILPKIND